MGTPADFWIVLAAIAAWSAVLVVIALFADRAAKFPGPKFLGPKFLGPKFLGAEFPGAKFTDPRLTPGLTED
jgi:hypothetical protein